MRAYDAGELLLRSGVPTVPAYIGAAFSVQASTTAACRDATASARNFRKVDREIKWCRR